MKAMVVKYMVILVLLGLMWQEVGWAGGDLLRARAWGERGGWLIGINKIILNGAETTEDEIRREVRGIAGGGYIFNIRIEAGTFYLGTIDKVTAPNGKHSQIDPRFGKGTFRGVSTDERVIELIPEAYRDDDYRKKTHNDFITIAQFFILYGMPDLLKLGDVTCGVLNEFFTMGPNDIDWPLYRLADKKLERLSVNETPPQAIISSEAASAPVAPPPPTAPTAALSSI